MIIQIIGAWSFGPADGGIDGGMERVEEPNGERQRAEGDAGTRDWMITDPFLVTGLQVLELLGTSALPKVVQVGRHALAIAGSLGGTGHQTLGQLASQVPGSRGRHGLALEGVRPSCGSSRIVSGRKIHWKPGTLMDKIWIP